ncbi:DUF2089 domain-containing protein [Luteolibacter pohnpeiensis]|uniref:DUF2089 domain-containing protein n=1 Tax=Luteolibacter pohnpeiensis TaxID=454153 RepID=UPI001905DF81|nr:DUF2089 domain-containing protein [Luteolibacter pohnpeiensis]
MQKPTHKKLVTRCPFCTGQLLISRLACDTCDTRIDSELPVPPFFKLPPDLQDFVLIFLRCQGKIRDVEKELGISYPTVCKRLALVNELLGNQSAPRDTKQILEELERGEITASEASQLLKQKSSNPS